MGRNTTSWSFLKELGRCLYLLTVTVVRTPFHRKGKRAVFIFKSLCVEGKERRRRLGSWKQIRV